MKAAGVSRTQLAAAMGVSDDTLRNYIQGATRPGADPLRAGAEALDVDIEQLLQLFDDAWRARHLPELSKASA